MSALTADVADITEALPLDPTLLLLTERHIRTGTGAKLRAAVAELGKRYYDASMDALASQSARRHAEREADELRTLCDVLTRRVQELEP